MTQEEEWQADHLRETEFSHHNQSLTRNCLFSILNFLIHQTGLNNGSFGACPRSVLEIQDKIRGEWLSNPDDFWYTLQDRLQLSSAAVARLIGDVSPKDIMIVDSLTFGFALIAHSICSHISQPNTAIILSNYTYNAVVKAITHYSSLAKFPPDIFTVTIPFPLLNAETAHDEILSAYEKTLQEIKTQGKMIVLGLMDHIISLPSMLMPVQDLIHLYRRYDVQEILVDGAHTPGQIDISSISHYGANYYLANLHKWCFAPSTAAFIWIDPNTPSLLAGHLHHPIVSHNYSNGLFAECAMLGTKDYSAMFSVPAGISYLDQLGVEKVIERNHQLCWRAMSFLSESWNTLDQMQPESLVTSMGMIGLPAEFGDTWEASDRVRLELREKYQIVVQKPFPIAGNRLYLRISAAVYNSWEQYVTLKEAILEMQRQSRLQDERVA
jgi:L-cysteine desulfhydrase